MPLSIDSYVFLDGDVMVMPYDGTLLAGGDATIVPAVSVLSCLNKGGGLFLEGVAPSSRDASAIMVPLQRQS